jgi:hypothetical protein
MGADSLIVASGEDSETIFGNGIVYDEYHFDSEVV